MKNKFIKQMTDTVSTNLPGLLTGIGIAGMVSATILAVTSTPKAMRLIDEAECEKGGLLTKKETVNVAWKCYIPTMVTTVVSAGCLIGAHSVNVKRNAALATAYKISETVISDYKDAIVETIGEEKAQEVEDQVAKKRIERDPVENKEVFLTGGGEILCYDSISGRYFKSDKESIRCAENNINRNLIDDIYVSLNDLYYELGLESTKIGDDLGWNLDQGLIKIKFSAQMAKDGQPCLVLEYNTEPKYDYARFK